MGGFTGFDYAALPFILRAKGVPESLWPNVLSAVEAISPIASKYWNQSEE